MSVSLVKGERISLEKAEKVNKMFFGLSWGKIENKTTKHNIVWGRKWGIIPFRIVKEEIVTSEEDVDLDAYAILLDKNNKELETIYYGRLKSSKGYSIYHSGDDRIGELDVDENDNEIITVDFTQLKENVKKIIFTVNSFKRQKFGLIPYIKLRIYEGAPNQPTNTHIEYTIHNNSQFKNALTLVIAQVYQHNNGWKVTAIDNAISEGGYQAIVSGSINSVGD